MFIHVLLHSVLFHVFFSDSSPVGFLRLCPLSFSYSLYLKLSHSHSCPLVYSFIFFTWRFSLKCCQMHANIQRHTHSVYPYCLRLLKSSYYYLPPLPQTAVCTYVCCVVVGVWCAQLRVIILWWTRDGKAGGLRSSGHAARPQPANQHCVPVAGKVQRTYYGTLWYSVTHRPHQNIVS